MANLKDLRVRIGSVKSTRKITSAMKMVAASRLRRAHEASIRSETYSIAMKKILTGLVKSLSERQEEYFVSGRGVIRPPKMLVGHQRSNTHLIIAMTSDKGLCGAFNMNVCKRVAGIVLALEKEGKQAKIMCVGKKGYELLRRDFQDLIISKFEGIGKKEVAYSEAEEVAFKAISLFEKGEVDSCTVVFNHFKSAISQEVRVEKLYPLDNFLEHNPWQGLSEMDFLTATETGIVDKDDWDYSDIMIKGEETLLENQEIEISSSRYNIKAEDTHSGRGSGTWSTRGISSRKKETSRKMSIPATLAGLKAPTEDLDSLQAKYGPYLYDFEPSDVFILERIIPRYIVDTIFRTLVESIASENGARMTSMDNATRNAGEMIDSLTLLYNRTRQGLITTELVEIISGAESV